MAETLGTLIDKLTIVRLKQWHSDSKEKSSSLNIQNNQLVEEIDVFLEAAMDGRLDHDRLTFKSNKIYTMDAGKIGNIDDGNGIGVAASGLAQTNCELWHAQEDIYDFKNVPEEKKVKVVEDIAALNLKRTKYIDLIDELFVKKLAKK